MLGFLILFPLVVAAVLLAVRNNQARKAIVGVSAAVIGVASIWLVVAYMGAPWVSFEFYSPVADYVCSAVGVLVAAAILYYGVRYRNVWACVLAAVQDGTLSQARIDESVLRILNAKLDAGIIS